MNMEDYRIALDEVRTLQSVISHHEELAFRVKGWYLAVIGALTFGLYHQTMGSDAFLCISQVMTVAFTIWLLFHREIVFLAIDRSNAVETSLSKLSNDVYDGPKVGVSLRRSQDWLVGLRSWLLRIPLINSPVKWLIDPEGGSIRRRARLIILDEQVLIPLVIAELAMLLLWFFAPVEDQPPPPPPPPPVGPVIQPAPLPDIPYTTTLD
jgi:hypothetical protein